MNGWDGWVHRWIDFCDAFEGFLRIDGFEMVWEDFLRCPLIDAGWFAHHRCGRPVLCQGYCPRP